MGTDSGELVWEGGQEFCLGRVRSEFCGNGKQCGEEPLMKKRTQDVTLAENNMDLARMRSGRKRGTYGKEQPL